MSVENFNTSYGDEVACMVKEQTEISDLNICCSQTLGQTKDRYSHEHQRSVKNEFILGSGDILTNEENVPCNNMSKTKEKCEKFGGPIADDEQRFLSILDRRRLAKKGAEKIECEWKETTNSDDESVKQKVSDLLDRLKKEFSEKTQARKQQRVNASDNAKHVWNNSVDSFLRYHEKPRVDIRYSESSGDQPGEGLYTFAVRPSKIRKRGIQEKTNFDKIMQTKQNTHHVEISVIRDQAIDEKTCEMPSDVVETLNGDVNSYAVPLCYKTPLILDTFYNYTISKLRKINAENIVNGTATNMRQKEFNVSPFVESNMSSLLLMYTVQRSANNYSHIDMVTPAYNAERSEHNIRQICNTMVPGLFNVYSQSALPFYGLPAEDINGHSVPPNNRGTRLTCNYSVPSCSQLKPEIPIDNVPHDTATIAVHGYFHQHIPVFKSSKAAFLEQRTVPICKALTFSDVLPDKDIPADVVTWCQDTSPTKELLAMAHISSNTEPPFDEATENKKLCCEEDTLNVSRHKQTIPDALLSTSPSKEELTTAEGDTLTELAFNNERSNETITGTTLDEFDDDSPFGLLSVFCRSAIHSGVGAVSEGEHLYQR